MLISRGTCYWRKISILLQNITKIFYIKQIYDRFVHTFQNMKIIENTGMHLIFTFAVLCMCRGLFRDNPSTSDAIFFWNSIGSHTKITKITKIIKITKNVVKFCPPQRPTLMIQKGSKNSVRGLFIKNGFRNGIILSCMW